jgi:hypothetical protein
MRMVFPQLSVNTYYGKKERKRKGRREERRAGGGRQVDNQSLCRWPLRM